MDDFLNDISKTVGEVGYPNIWYVHLSFTGRFEDRNNYDARYEKKFQEIIKTKLQQRYDSGLYSQKFEITLYKKGATRNNYKLEFFNFRKRDTTGTAKGNMRYYINVRIHSINNTFDKQSTYQIESNKWKKYIKEFIYEEKYISKYISYDDIYTIIENSVNDDSVCKGNFNKNKKYNALWKFNSMTINPITTTYVLIENRDNKFIGYSNGGNKIYTVVNNMFSGTMNIENNIVYNMNQSDRCLYKYTMDNGHNIIIDDRRT